ncbi:MAG: squalene synthase HpnC, partial [Burkholderiales bacterium]
KHYENFPVASIALPKSMRKPVSLIYAFARQADDFADEGERNREERIFLLNGFRLELERIRSRKEPETALFAELSTVIRQYGLPLEPFHDLLDAFAQDVDKKRYENFTELASYCEKSANPVGRLLLILYGVDSERNRFYSDKICSSLQLINFLQDVEIDYAMGRIYLPQDEMMRFGISESDIASRHAGQSWQALMAFQADRARKMMLEGAPLAKIMKGRLSFEMKLIVLGGLAVLDKLEKVSWDVYRNRPRLERRDWLQLLPSAFFSGSIFDGK